ncbi:ATP-binding protein [Streptomyces sp. NPDC013172]|uniref:sensor histidine kinase n=1 Tax=Streptomyces sp. NPDC013172 TaxID=3155009 RepID=UPI0033FAE5F2
MRSGNACWSVLGTVEGARPQRGRRVSVSRSRSPASARWDVLGAPRASDERVEDVASGDQVVDRRVDPATLFRQAVNEPGGWISVAVRTEADPADTVSLVVESSGPVLNQRRVTDLAQPFRRLGADRTGTGQGSGLGLSIVAAIIQAHDGTLELRARPDGGLRVTITLPRTDGRATAQAPGAETGVAR